MAMVPTSWFLPLPSPQGSDAITTLGHAGLMQRSSLVPLLDQFSRSDFIFPNFPFAQFGQPVRPVTLGFDSFSITIMSHASNLGSNSPPLSSSQLTPEQQALMLLQTQMQQLQAQIAAQQAAAAQPPGAIPAAVLAIPAPAPAGRPIPRDSPAWDHRSIFEPMEGQLTKHGARAPLLLACRDPSS